jgi:hypothetical protein
MHGFSEAGSTDGSPADPPPDWPVPGTPLPGEEPTIELPVVTEAMLAADPPRPSPKPVRNLTRLSRARRVPALERRGPRPAGTARIVALDDLFHHQSTPADADHPTHPGEPTPADHPASPGKPEHTDNPTWSGQADNPTWPDPAGDPTRPHIPADADADADADANADDPARSGNPAAADSAAYPHHLGDPADATNAHPSEPAGADDPARSGNPARPAGSAHPGSSADPGDPAHPGGLVHLGGSAHPGDPAHPGGPGDHVDGPASEAGSTRPSRRWAVAAGIAAAALLLTGATVVVLSHDRGPADRGATGRRPPAAAPADPGDPGDPGDPVPQHTVTAALAGRTSAGFDLVDGAEQVTVRAADLGDTLFRVSTPEAGSSVPRADEQGGRVRLRLDGDARAVDISLNAAVLWDLRVAGGAQLSTIDLSAGRVGGVELTGGASRITLTLPRPDGTLGVRMSGGVGLFDVRTAERFPVRVRVGRGAGQVTLNGQSHAGVAAGQMFTPAAWGAAVDRVDVDAEAGMSSLTVAPY